MTHQIRKQTTNQPSLSIFLGSVGLCVFMATPAFAGIDDDAAKCMQEIRKNPTAADAPLKFKSAHGGRLQRLRFEMTRSGVKQDVICKIRRGVVVDIDWPDEN